MPRISAVDLPTIFAEANNDSPRGATIILSTVLEAALEDCICARLLPYPMSNTHRDTLFGGEAGFAGFSAKIDLGYSLGLYGIKTKADMHFIRKIRNEFAHYAPRDFSHPEIVKYCHNLTDYARPDSVLKMPDNPTEEIRKKVTEFNMRYRFTHCANRIGMDLYGEVKDNDYRPPQPKLLP